MSTLCDLRSTLALPAVLALGAPALGAAAAPDVLVVDRDGTSGAYAEIQPAVDAAAPGDTILVRARGDAQARYLGFEVDGKSLTIRGEGRPLVLTGRATVRNIGVGETVVLRGLDMNRRQISGTVLPVADTTGPGLTLESSAGAVRLVDCSMEGSFGARMWAGLQLFGALDVTLHRCLVLGAIAPDLAEVGGSGLQASSSRVSVYGSDVVGGKGFTGSGSFQAHGSDGGTGLALFNRSVAWLASSTVTGGAGGDADCSIYPCDDFPGDGGTGVLVTTASLCFESRTAIAGGAGGETGFNSFQPNGDPGVATDGTVVSDPETDVEFHAEAELVRSGDLVRVTVTGIPGESARLAIARRGGFRFFGVSRGVLQISDYVGGIAFAPLGVIPTSGTIVADVPLPAAGSPAASATYYLQVALDASPGTSDFRLSAPVAVHVDGADVPSVFDREVVRVDPSAPPGGDGRSWATACNSLEEAITYLPWSGGDVWLREGPYVLASQDGVLLGSNTRVLGGFVGTEVAASEADPAAHPTTFDGDVLGNGSGALTGVDNTRTILRVGSLELGLFATSVEVRGIEFVRAVDASSHRGAIVTYGDVVVEQCGFARNRTAPIRHFAGDLSVRRCAFEANTALRCAGIHASSIGGATPSMSVGVSSSLFNGNVCEFAGAGAIYTSGCESLRVNNSTFTANVRIGFPGAISTGSTQSVWITNSVFDGNSFGTTNPDITSQIRLAAPQALVFQYNSVNDITALFHVNGNVVGDPTFVDADGANGVRGDEDDDLRLDAGSHAIDAGNSLYLRPWALFDLDGNARRSDDPAVPDTGVGGAPVVDMGAYER